MAITVANDFDAFQSHSFLVVWLEMEELITTSMILPQEMSDKGRFKRVVVIEGQNMIFDPSAHAPFRLSWAHTRTRQGRRYTPLLGQEGGVSDKVARPLRARMNNKQVYIDFTQFLNDRGGDLWGMGKANKSLLFFPLIHGGSLYRRDIPQGNLHRLPPNHSLNINIDTIGQDHVLKI